MKIALFSLLIVFLTNCSHTPTYTPSPKEASANQIMKKVAVKLLNEKDLRPFGSGGRTMHEIKLLALSFNYYHDITIEDGRELLIYAVNECTATVNADESIRPYLANYPFKPENVEIEIFLRNPDGTNPALGKLVVLSAAEGKLRYKIDNPETKLFTTVLKETFKEAESKICHTTGDSVFNHLPNGHPRAEH